MLAATGISGSFCIVPVAMSRLWFRASTHSLCCRFPQIPWKVEVVVILDVKLYSLTHPSWKPSTPVWVTATVAAGSTAIEQLYAINLGDTVRFCVSIWCLCILSNLNHDSSHCMMDQIRNFKVLVARAALPDWLPQAAQWFGFPLF